VTPFDTIGPCKQESPFLAKKLGARLVAENVANILGEHFEHRDKDTKAGPGHA
jgi:hypothetical protein